MSKQTAISNPCHYCKDNICIGTIYEGKCPCPSYKDYLDHLFRQGEAEGKQEINEIMDEIRTDSPSPILQGEGGAKGNV